MKTLFKIFWASLPFAGFFVFMVYGMGIEITLMIFGGVGLVGIWLIVASKLWPLVGREYNPYKPIGKHEDNPFDRSQLQQIVYSPEKPTKPPKVTPPLPPPSTPGISPRFGDPPKRPPPPRPSKK